MKLILILLFCTVKLFSCNADNLKILYPPQFTRIVGGADAEDGQTPYQCSIQLNKRHFCGCALISSEWIVTAGHCVNGQRPESIAILVGTNDLKSGGTYYNVQKFIKHPKFNQPLYAYDIALIRVQGTIAFDSKVQPIAYSSSEVPENSTLQLTGWGRLTTGGIIPQQLQIIYLRSISTERCKQIYNYRNVHDGHLCTFNKAGEGACNGDSGGPLVYEDKLVGIVNWGVPCARGYPDAFAKVSYFFDWLEETVRSSK